MTALPSTVLAGGLAVVGVVAAGPGSAVLARASWPERSPAGALALWQALCLCAGLSFTGAAMALAAAPLGRSLPAALIAMARNTFNGSPFRGLSFWRAALLVLAVIFACTLLAVLIRCFVLALRRRTAHRELLDLLTGSATSDDVRVLDHTAPAAYSLPGWHTRLVLTAGLLRLLTPAQLTAVVAHERAHLTSHHDLLLLPFQAWAAALGRVPGVYAAQRSVAALAEMQADDAAARLSGTDTVASALTTVALAQVDARAATSRASELPDVVATAVVRRVSRLREPHPLPAARVALVYLSALALLVIPTSLLLFGRG
ncbi:MAG: M56 family metallopeptidase [Nakamurella sp.]